MNGRYQSALALLCIISILFGFMYLRDNIGILAGAPASETVEAHAIYDTNKLLTILRTTCASGQSITNMPPVCGTTDCLRDLPAPSAHYLGGTSPRRDLSEDTVKLLLSQQGLSNPIHLHVINLLSNIQWTRGIYGSVGEIGVYRGFLTGMLAYHVDTASGERLFAVDTFEKTDNKSDLNYNMIQNKNVFFAHMAQLGFKPDSNDTAKRLHVWYDTSAHFTKLSFSLMNLPSVRMLSLDGLHYNTIIWHEIIQCLCILRQGGIIIFDDIISTKFREHVIKGIADVFKLISPDILRPLVAIQNKLYMTTSEWHLRYLNDIKQALPNYPQLRDILNITNKAPVPLRKLDLSYRINNKLVSFKTIPFFDNFPYFLGPTPGVA